ncbi:MAG: hypothetical protein CL912_26365 [Deltaproteobacteria bacterium]|nr:hypothetical protein [Deltaproteobacteria bacterium]
MLADAVEFQYIYHNFRQVRDALLLWVASIFSFCAQTQWRHQQTLAPHEEEFEAEERAIDAFKVISTEKEAKKLELKAANEDKSKTA